MNDFEQLSEQQLQALRNLHFWLRNLQVASIEMFPNAQKAQKQFPMLSTPATDCPFRLSYKIGSSTQHPNRLSSVTSG